MKFNKSQTCLQVLAKLTTHFVRVHYRLCTDEAELADHVFGLTRSLASCQFRCWKLFFCCHVISSTCNHHHTSFYSFWITTPLSCFLFYSLSVQFSHSFFCFTFNCRKKLTQLSVNANGSFIPKDFIDRNLIKKSPWWVIFFPNYISDEPACVHIIV